MLSSPAKVCFNSSCKSTTERWRRGWRRRTGDYANLCDPCGYAYEEGKFCEMFHSNNSGWRCCESCGKQIHCGCIVSLHMFVLLDAGGIECLTCSKRSYMSSPNPTWAHPPHFLTSQPGKIKDFSVNTLNALVSSGPVQWRSFNGSDIQQDVKSPFEVNMSNVHGRFNISDQPSVSPPEMKKESIYGRVITQNLRFVPSEARLCGKAGVKIKEQHSSFTNDLKPIFQRNDHSSSDMNLGSMFSKRETDIAHISDVHSQRAVALDPSERRACNHNGNDSSGKGQVHDEQTRGDWGGQNQFMASNHLISNKELQQISKDSKPVTIPLFEKILSASDARRFGRLVVPKKCAEAYFPQITYPEGVPMKIQDVTGKEWALQFRFWSNNRSRMYVLEGITPCIESMDLRAGDVVAFSRLDAEGKLVISGRKTSPPTLLSQVADATAMRNGASKPSNGGATDKARDITSFDRQLKERLIEDKVASNGKKDGFSSSKRKRLRFNNGNVVELEITFKEAQALMRPSETFSSMTVVDGCEFEEFQDSAPLIGMPSIMGTNQLGESFQWVRCEDCLKWRKVPSDALLPFRWLCSDNILDQDRSKCSAAEELSKEQLELLLLSASPNRAENAAKQYIDSSPVKTDKAAAGPSSSLDEHPRHNPDCTCLVCIRLKRRFRTLMEECAAAKQRQSEAEKTRPQKRRLTSSSNGNSCSSLLNVENVDSSPFSPPKCQIDLNVQPEREDEGSSSPDSSSGNVEQKQ